MRRDTRRLAKALRRRADVASADPNYVRHATAVPTDELYPFQWHYPLIWLPEAWDLVAPASGIVVAVIDTGVVDEHPDLQGQLVPGYDFIQSTVRSRDGDGCDADPSDAGDRALPNGDSSFHGTHVTGTIVAKTSLAPGAGSAGVAGVAWNAKVMPLRVLGVGGGTDFDLIQALRYAAGLSNTCGVLPAAPADVINLSLGGPQPSSTVDAAIAQVRAAGLVVVAAAGNSGDDLPSYPAASPGVISVSAVDAQRNLAPYSNFGPTIDVAAPGGDLSRDRNGDGFADGVLSTLFDEDTGQYNYVGYQGTSMAAPHVAGVIALMLGVNPALTPADIDNLLATGEMTRDIGSSTFFGRGLIDAFKSVSAAIRTEGGAAPGLPPRLVANPGAVNFGASSTQVNLTLSNAGGPSPPLSVTSFQAITDDGGAWLSIQQGNVDANGLGTYTLRVTRAGLGDGIYTGAARFHTNTGDLDVPVIVQVGDAVATTANAGHHYVLLVDPDTDPPLTAFAVQVEPQNGRYHYRFVDVDPGRYYIYAGTDVDNDNFLCDRGEACGSYPTLEQPQVVEVNENMGDLDFLTGFGLRIGATAAQAEHSGISRRIGPAQPPTQASASR
jgi:serine protease